MEALLLHIIVLDGACDKILNSFSIIVLLVDTNIRENRGWVERTHPEAAICRVVEVSSRYEACFFFNWIFAVHLLSSSFLLERKGRKVNWCKSLAKKNRPIVGMWWNIHVHIHTCTFVEVVLQIREEKHSPLHSPSILSIKHRSTSFYLFLGAGCSTFW